MLRDHISQGIIRITNKDEEILLWIQESLEKFNFNSVLDCPIALERVPAVRINGGIPKHKIFATVNPKI